MPGIVIPLHELFERHAEIPDVDDCYLVGLWNPRFAEDAVDGEDGGHPMWELPYKASKFPPLEGARDCYHLEDWDGWRWDGKPDGSCRIGCNTYTLSHPISLRFRWGEGVPGVPKDLEMLSHEPADWDRSFRFCKHCSKEVNGAPIPQDCPVRRLRAMAEAVKNGMGGEHIRAVELWHQPRKET